MKHVVSNLSFLVVVAALALVGQASAEAQRPPAAPGATSVSTFDPSAQLVGTHVRVTGTTGFTPVGSVTPGGGGGGGTGTPGFCAVTAIWGKSSFDPVTGDGAIARIAVVPGVGFTWELDKFNDGLEFGFDYECVSIAEFTGIPSNVSFQHHYPSKTDLDVDSDFQPVSVPWTTNGIVAVGGPFCTWWGTQGFYHYESVAEQAYVTSRYASNFAPVIASASPFTSFRVPGSPATFRNVSAATFAQNYPTSIFFTSGVPVDVTTFAGCFVDTSPNGFEFDVSAAGVPDPALGNGDVWEDGEPVSVNPSDELCFMSGFSTAGGAVDNADTAPSGSQFFMGLSSGGPTGLEVRIEGGAPSNIALDCIPFDQN